MAAGAVLTLVVSAGPAAHLLPGMWLLLYGAGVVSGGSPLRCASVPAMGALLHGRRAPPRCFVPGQSPPTCWLAAGFGGLHILFGTIIAVNYGG
jgi:hypothetical protein